MKSDDSSFNDSQLLNVLCSELRDERVFENLCAVIQHTVKTHKHKVVPRVLHCSINNPFSPGMRLCAKLLKQRISHLTHLFRDSSDYLQKLNKCRFDSNTKVYRFDIKDFFMSGAHSTIINSCASEIHENIRDPFRLLLGAILSSQYVKLPEALRVLETGKAQGWGC